MFYIRVIAPLTLRIVRIPLLLACSLLRRLCQWPVHLNITHQKTLEEKDLCNPRLTMYSKEHSTLLMNIGTHTKNNMIQVSSTKKDQSTVSNVFSLCLDTFGKIKKNKMCTGLWEKVTFRK